jgi:hypothetical protein
MPPISLPIRKPGVVIQGILLCLTLVCLVAVIAEARSAQRRWLIPFSYALVAVVNFIA